MILNLALKRMVHPEQHPSGILTWDSEKGTVEGFDAERVMRAAQEMIAMGGLSLPAPGLYTDKNPLHDKEAMAILLHSLGYRFPKQLAKFCKPFRVKKTYGFGIDY